MSTEIENKKPEAPVPLEGGIIPVLLYGMYCALGVSTIILGPLPMIVTHIRLADTFAKGAALLGSWVAISFFAVPAAQAVMVFILGVFIADRASRGASLKSLLLSVGIVGGVAGVGALWVASQMEGLTVILYWNHLVDQMMELLKVSAALPEQYSLSDIRTAIYSKGPFFYLSIVLFSTWICVGMVAHLGIFPKGHSLSSESLRKVRFPKFISIGFVVLLVLSTWLHSGVVEVITSGALQVTQTILFIGGGIWLSSVLHKKAVGRFVRSLTYAVCMILGFFPLVGMGVITPWIPKNWLNIEKQGGK